MSGASGQGKIVGVDVGGTFTDFFVFDSANRSFSTFKVSSNRGSEAKGFVEGLQSLGAISAISAIVHGTTAGTNALLERKVARTGLITTAGFRDVLEMRRRDRPTTWGLWGDFVPLIERDMRIEVCERTLADGAIRNAVEPEEVRAAAHLLLSQGAQALAIVFINAYANPQNEQAALAVVRDIWPNEHVAISSAILPEIREFERTSTTVVNACLQPVVGTYIAQLEQYLQDNGFAGSFHIVQSNGGVMSTALARALPARTALSGPAAGVVAASAIAKAAGHANVITGDLGGTSFDVALIRDGIVAQSAQTTVDFGIVIRTPMIEINTIGAGGGSIARVDASGLLQVGPQSAGSVPGPACYGRGNTQPTLTDANLLLGRINADAPIGGGLRFDTDAARMAIETEIARPLGIDVMAAAEAIVRVANAHMAGAIRLVSIERGNDPAKFVLMPFGGGGALHAGQLILEVGLQAAIVPRFPGITSALGCVLADLRHDRVETLNTVLENIDWIVLGQRMSEAGNAVAQVIRDSGSHIEEVTVEFEFDMQYVGQTHTVSVPLAVAHDTTHTRLSPAQVRSAFEASYRQQFNRLLDGAQLRIVSLRTIAIGRRPAFDMASLMPALDPARATPLRGSRAVWFSGGWRETPVFARLELPCGHRIEGPAILEQPDATIVVDPGLAAITDSLGNVVLQRT